MPPNGADDKPKAKSQNARLKEENELIDEQNRKLLAKIAYMRSRYEILKSQLRAMKGEGSPTTIKQLPPEILLMIFERAIPPNTLLDSALFAGPNSPWARTLEMKKNLTLVCRGWYPLTATFLYEEVTIRRLPQLVWLLRTLKGTSMALDVEVVKANGNQKEKAKSADLDVDLGKLVKSLEINCYIPTSESIAPAFGRALLQVQTLCTSLRRIAFSSQSRIPSSIFYNTNERALSSSITELHLDAIVDYSTSQRIIYEVCDRLEYLRFSIQLGIAINDADDTPVANVSPDVCDPGMEREESQGPLTLPHLRTLWIEDHWTGWKNELRLLSGWALPSLERFIISNNALATDPYVQSTDDEDQEDLDEECERELVEWFVGNAKKMQRHGGSGCVQGPGPGATFKYVYVPFRGRHTFIQGILDACPLLERLAVGVAKGSTAGSSNADAPLILHAHPTLRHLDLIQSTGSNALTFVLEDMPSLVGSGCRRFGILPGFAMDWFHVFDVGCEEEMEDAFEVGVFRCRLVKRKERVEWVAGMSLHRKGVEDEDEEDDDDDSDFRTDEESDEDEESEVDVGSDEDKEDVENNMETRSKSVDSDAAP